MDNKEGLDPNFVEEGLKNINVPDSSSIFMGIPTISIDGGKTALKVMIGFVFEDDTPKLIISAVECKPIQSQEHKNILEDFKYYDLRSGEEQDIEKKAQNVLDNENEQLARKILNLQQQIKTPEKDAAIKEIGEYLCVNGGNDRMALVAYRVSYLGGSSRQLEYDWTGICGWHF